MSIYASRFNLFISKEEKARRIIDLYYNQGKTYHEIVEELNVSPNYVSAVLKKHEEEENAAAAAKIKHEQQENKTSKEVASFKLFSEGKNTIEVAIDLKLSEEEVTQFYKGFLKLKGLYKFGIIYEKHGHHVPRLLKLCIEAEKEGVDIEQLVKLAKLADENNPVGLSQLEKLRQWHLSEFHGMETERHGMETQLHGMKIEKEKYENVLFVLKSEISTLKDQLEDYRKSRERERLELEKLKKEKESIEESLRLGDIAE
jgi:DNA-binding CsgD family transcriptional regulator